MKEKYAKEMILVPREQVGGGSDDSMEQFWKRRLLVDELANATHVDRMMKVTDDMSQSRGRALPTSIPDYAAGSSDYFRSQRQLQQLQPLHTTSTFSDRDLEKRRRVKKETPRQRVGVTRPPRPTSFQDSVDRHRRTDQDLETFRSRAKEDLSEPRKTGNTAQIEAAQQCLAIIDRNIDDIRAQDDELDDLAYHFPDKDKQTTYGEEDEMDWRQNREELLKERRDRRYRQLKRLYPDLGEFSPAPSPTTRSSRLSTRPPDAHSFREAVDRSNTIERDLEDFRSRAEAKVTEAERRGGKTQLTKVKQHLAIVLRNIDDILDTDTKIDRFPLSDEHHEKTFGKEDRDARRRETLEDWKEHRDRLYRELESLFPKQRIKPKQRGRSVWRKPRGWVEE